MIVNASELEIVACSVHACTRRVHENSARKRSDNGLAEEGPEALRGIGHGLEDGRRNQHLDLRIRIALGFVPSKMFDEIRERLAADGAEAVGSKPEEFGALIKSEIERWRKVVEVAKIPKE